MKGFDMLKRGGQTFTVASTGRTFGPCVKCEGSDLYIRHHVGSSDFGGDERHCGRYHDVVVQATEHLHLTCRRCGFVWTEDVSA